MHNISMLKHRLKDENILFLQPLYYNPTLPNFCDKYKMLSKALSGFVVSTTAEPNNFQNLKFGKISYYPIRIVKNNYIKNIIYFLRYIFLGIQLHRKRKITIIHSYDALLLGLIAVFLKYIFKCRLIIEVNGHLTKANFIGKQTIKLRFKFLIFTKVTKFVFRRANCIKFLNHKQILELKGNLENKPTTIFHDYVPTHVFNPQKSKEKQYILFLGHPFHLKGVDILIEAFNKISSYFPEVNLKIIGHCPGGENERDVYRQLRGGNTKIQILNPVFYHDAIKLIQNCKFLVLPSRSEAMGRVLIEAMACKKAIIGSNVGGIPDLIIDNFNGMLFQAGSVKELSEKMERLLSDSKLRRRLGNNGFSLSSHTFSAEKYMEYFTQMVIKTLDHDSSPKKIARRHI
jgi:glycosyltransferase involved in cell wall biosynthesis